jgi:hypothetical protein
MIGGSAQACMPRPAGRTGRSRSGARPDPPRTSRAVRNVPTPRGSGAVSSTWPSRVLSCSDERSGDPHLLPDVFSPDGYGLDRNMESNRRSEGSLATHRARIQPAAGSRGFARNAGGTGWRKRRPRRNALPVVHDRRHATGRHLQLIGDNVSLVMASASCALPVCPPTYVTHRRPIVLRNG